MSTGTEWVDDHFIGGDPALDLANTVWRRTPEVGADLLDSPATLDAWLARTGVVSPEATDHATGALVTALRGLRGLLWDAFEAQRAGAPPPPVAIAGILDHAQGGSMRDLHLTADGALTARSTRAAEAVLALSALRLLLSPPPQGVRACDGCGWYFVDTSRSRRRRWCSMRTCGNQHKVDRYRATHR